MTHKIRPEGVKAIPSFSLRLGNQTAFAASGPMEPFEFAIANHFTAFEFFPDRGPAGNGGWDEREINAEARQYIRTAAAANDIRLSIHAPLEFNPLNAPECDRLYSSVGFAADIGARVLNLHLDASRGADKFVQALGPALLATAEAGLELVLENTVFTGPDDFNQVFAAMNNNVPHWVRHTGMCFDLGHANACSATQNDYLKFLDQLSEQVVIRHLHLHENYGDRDSHLTLFTGPSAKDDSGLRGFVERLQRRSFNGCGIFEQWPQPTSLLTNARDGLVKLQKSLHNPRT